MFSVGFQTVSHFLISSKSGLTFVICLPIDVEFAERVSARLLNRFPDSKANERCRKDTRVLTNAPLSYLSRMCSGNHVHVHCIGGVRTRQGWVKRSKLAGHYPTALCRAWAKHASIGAQEESPGHSSDGELSQTAMARLDQIRQVR